MESDVHLSVEAQKLWNATLKSLKQMRDPRKSMQDVMSFHAASGACPNFCVNGSDFS